MEIEYVKAESVKPDVKVDDEEILSEVEKDGLIVKENSVYLDSLETISNPDVTLEINEITNPSHSSIIQRQPELEGINIDQLEVEEEEVITDFIIEDQTGAVLDSRIIHVDPNGQYIQIKSGDQYVQFSDTAEYIEIAGAEQYEVEEESQDYSSTVGEESLENEEVDEKIDGPVDEEESLSELDEDNEIEGEDSNVEDPQDPDFEVKGKLKKAGTIYEENYHCTICSKSFKTSASIKRHVTVCHFSEKENQDDPLAFELCYCCGEPVDSAHTTGDYKCSECDKLFVMSKSVERHKSIEHSKETWKCVECDKSFKERQKLIEHMALHPLKKSFFCKECHREFSRKYHLYRHYAQTGCNGKTKSSLPCPICSKTIARKDNLRDHIRRSHVGNLKKKKTFVCKYCDKEFRSSTLLVVHMRTHTGERPYPCDMCPKRFPSSGAMKKHRRMHTGEKPYTCDKCGARFAAKETLNRHVRTHTGHKPHKCQFCGKSFIQAAQLRAHIFHHTGENAYTCEHCNRAFNRRARLTMHIKFVHEGAEPLQCKQCDKNFYRKEDLSRHLLLHSGVKSFECDVCNKKFAVKSSLKLHSLTHRQEQPCKCDECGRAFIRQDCLLRHMRAKHRELLEDIMANAEKKRIQQQLLKAASDAASENGDKQFPVGVNQIWNELTLTDSIKELLALLVDEETLKAFGWPDAPVDKILDSVIKRCGHKPASDEDFTYIGRLRENAKLLFTVVIDDEAVKTLLNNQTVDEVIMHVLRLAKMD